MNDVSNGYLQRLKEIYSGYNDNDSLLALAEVEEMEERARELSIYREQPKTIELINKTLERHNNCMRKLTDPRIKMSEMEREICFVAMDWCRFTLDIIGESPERINNASDKIIEEYAKKAKII